MRNDAWSGASSSKLEDKWFCPEREQAFPDFNLILVFSRIQFWFVKDITKYLNTSTLSNEVLSVYILWLHPASWSRDMIMYFVLSAFMFSSVSLLAMTRASAFFFIVCTLLPNILTSSALTRSWCDHLTSAKLVYLGPPTGVFYDKVQKQRR